MNKKITFALDQNLKLNVDDPVWQKFFRRFNVTPLFYTDMRLLTEKMQENTVHFAYLPTANFFYFTSNSFYTPLANALFRSNNDTKDNCVLIVSKESEIDSLDQLQGKTQGYIHSYCTSSYFALALLLWRNHFSIHHFFSSLKKVGPWQEQIDAVISGEVDATMVLESVWKANPYNKEKTKIIAKEQNLPSPLILYGKNVEADLLSEFKKLLFSYKSQDSVEALFNGFVPFQKELTEHFCSEAVKAFANTPHQNSAKTF